MSTFVASRLRTYYERNGLAPTIQRICVGVRRILFHNRMILMYCDLAKLDAPEDLPSSLQIERKTSCTDLTERELQDIVSFWNPTETHKNLRLRFQRGATLWVIKSSGNLAGYIWTIQGDTIVPHYFPLGPDDVHFFDLLIFPKYRGRAMNWILVMHVLHQLAAVGVSRVFSEVKEWNEVSLASFTMTPFRIQGSCRKVTLFGRSLVWWNKS
jgi:ribosomal protein S18 acetylase RimI-like enzyme